MTVGAGFAAGALTVGPAIEVLPPCVVMVKLAELLVAAGLSSVVMVDEETSNLLMIEETVKGIMVGEEMAAEEGGLRLPYK